MHRPIKAQHKPFQAQFLRAKNYLIFSAKERAQKLPLIHSKWPKMLKSQTPCGSNEARCWDAKPGECYGSPKKLPPRKAALFQNNGLSQEFNYIQVMGTPCCGKLLPSSKLKYLILWSKSSTGSTGAHTRDTRWVKVSPFLHTVRLCRTGSIKWTWKCGQMAHQVTNQPFVDRLTQPLNMCLRKTIGQNQTR